VKQASELELVLQKALSSPTAAIVNIQVAQAENVYPMVPAGAGLEEMLLA
jgi:acetolactate synthase, large subunit (EC 2.2.1.6)